MAKEAYDIWWGKASEKEIKEAFAFCEEYTAFLNACKTERECTDYAVERLTKKKFIPLDKILSRDAGKKPSLKPGDKVFRTVWGKAVLAAVIGKQPVSAGVNIVATHIDSPRLDLKPSPFYEDSHMVLAKTRYYGGIKKYQWVCVPLALRGVVYLKDGSKVTISVGDKEGDPCFIITDLLPHLAYRQMDKKANEVITGEGLNVLLGSMPEIKPGNGADAVKADAGKASAADKGATVKDLSGKDAPGKGAEESATAKDAASDDKAGQAVKANLLRILKETYGIDEIDFVSAEIEAVPALAAKDIGFDRSMIGGYGHDDRVCSYAALKALMDIKGTPERTTVVYLADKEEVGSQGNTGAQSAALGNFLAELCAAGDGAYTDLTARRCFASSFVISGDVASAVDPNFKDVQDHFNANFIGKGMVLEKYTGRGGKGGGNDANPEYIAALRQIFDTEGVAWQTGELGRVDLGGGGTVAAFMANMGMQVVDGGVPMLCMHAPYEVVSKGDVYNTYKGYKAFLTSMK